MQTSGSRGVQRPDHEGEAVSTRGGGTDLVPRELPAGGTPRLGPQAVSTQERLQVGTCSAEKSKL